MKSFNGKTILFILLVTIAALCVISCSDDPIFSAIEAEVKLKDPSVRGTVLSLVHHDGDLYTANGNIYRRTAGTGGWSRIDLPSGAYRCSQLAVTREDGTGELFGLFQNSSWQFHSLQRYTGSGWTQITGATQGYAIKNGNNFIYFFRQEYISNDENATIETSVHQVNEVGTVSLILDDFTYQSGTGELPIDAQGGFFTTNRGVYTSTGAQITGGDEPTNHISGIAVNGTNVYVVDGAYVYHRNGGNWSRLSHNASWRIHGLTYLDAGGKRMVLIPTEDGYGEMLIGGSGELLAYQEPGASSSSSISTSTQDQYESTLEDWNLLSMFVVTNPVPAGNDYVIYAGIMDPEEDGLWSYYSDTRQEWNRE